MNLLKKTIVVSLCCLLVTKFTCAQDDYEEELGYEDNSVNDQLVNDGINPPLPDALESLPPLDIEPATNDLTSTVKSLQNFSFNLFNSIHHGESSQRNMVISTSSTFITMAILRSGLGGESLRQMNNLLESERINNVEIGNTLQDIFSDKPAYELDYASRIYVDKSIQLRKPFKTELSKLRVTPAKRLNFSTNLAETRRKINNYVRRKTRRLIDEIVPESGISANTKIYLVNAMYLKAKWQFTFLRKDTEMKKFHLDNSNSIMVSTMHTNSAPCNFYRNARHQADIAVLPLHENLSMLFVMPQDIGNFSKLFDDEQNSMKNKFYQIINEIWSEENNRERYPEACAVDLPKFSLQYQTDLITSLQRLGLRDVFDTNNADLSHMTNTKNLYVSDAAHKAVLTVNEEGIEAAAATSVGVSLRRTPERGVHINKPFLFAIRQDLTGAILFVGKVVRP